MCLQELCRHTIRTRIEKNENVYKIFKRIVTASIVNNKLVTLLPLQKLKMRRDILKHIVPSPLNDSINTLPLPQAIKDFLNYCSKHQKEDRSFYFEDFNPPKNPYVGRFV
jgi:hypothetical protein